MNVKCWIDRAGIILDWELSVFWRVKFIPIIYYRTNPDLKCMSGCFYKFISSQTFCEHTPLELYFITFFSKLPIGPICNPNCPVGTVLKFSQDYSVFRRQDPQSSRWCSHHQKALRVPHVFDDDDPAPLNYQDDGLIEPSHSPSPQDSVILPLNLVIGNSVIRWGLQSSPAGLVLKASQCLQSAARCLPRNYHCIPHNWQGGKNF